MKPYLFKQKGLGKLHSYFLLLTLSVLTGMYFKLGMHENEKKYTLLDRKKYDDISDERSSKYYIVMCMAVKRAGDILPETIIRNYLSGVDHFYISDNNDDEEENLTDILSPLSRIITIEKLKSNDGIQRYAHWNCLQKFQNLTVWIGFFDSDETIEAAEPENHASNAEEFSKTPFLRSILLTLEGIEPCIRLNWKSILSNGRLIPAIGHTLGSAYPFVCGSRDEIKCREFKTCNSTSSKILSSCNLWNKKHFYKPSEVDFRYFRTDGSDFKGMVHSVPIFKKEKHGSGKKLNIVQCKSEKSLFLAHYHSRSVTDYLFRLSRGRPNRSKNRKVQDMKDREKCCWNLTNPKLEKSITWRDDMVSLLLKTFWKTPVIPQWFNKATIFNSNVVSLLSKKEIEKDVDSFFKHLAGQKWINQSIHTKMKLKTEIFYPFKWISIV